MGEELATFCGLPGTMRYQGIIAGQKVLECVVGVAESVGTPIFRVATGKGDPTTGSLRA